MHFTLWPHLRGSTGRHAEIEWADLVAFVASPQVAPDKQSLEGWSPAKFTGDVRRAAACEFVSCIVLDLDGGELDTEALCAALDQRAGIVHTSYSHTDKHPKHRVVLRTSRNMTPDEYARVWAVVVEGLPVDAATRDPSRLWFVPAHGEGMPYVWRELIGSPLDVDALLASTPCPQIVDSAPKPPAASSDRRAPMAAALAAAWPAKGRHEAQLALAGALRNEGWPEAEALEFLVAVAGDRTKREATIRHTYARPEGSSLTGWTRLKSFVDPVIVDAARGALGRDAALLERVTRAKYRDPDKIIEASIKPATDNPLGIIWGGWDEPVIVPPYLLEGLIPSEKVCTFFAEGGSIKSWVAFELAISVATGRPWLGAVTVNGGKPGRALILDFEDGREEFKRRKQILVRDGDNAPLPLLGYKYAATDVLDPQVWIDLAGLGLSLLVVDSLGAAMPGDADENATSFAAAVKHAGKFTTYTKCTVVFVAHANKTGGMRGTGAIRDQSDCAFTFVPVSETENGEEKRMRLVCDKPGPQKKPAPVNIMLSDRGLVTFKDDEVPEPPPEERIRAAMISTLRNSPEGVNKCVLRDMVHGKTEIKREVLAQLIGAKLVTEFHMGREVILKYTGSK